MSGPRAWSTAALIALAASVGARAAGGAQVQAWQLDDATTVALVEDHRTSLVSVRLEFPVGGWSPWAWSSHAEEAFEIQLHDTAGEMRSRADALAVDVALYLDGRAASLVLSAATESLEPALELVRELLEHRAFDRAELKRRTRQRSIAWRGSRKVPQSVGVRELAHLFFGPEDPRRRPHDKPRRLETDVERLAAVRDTLVRLPGRVVAFAGDLTRQRADELARRLLPAALAAAPPEAAPALRPLIPRERRPAEHTVRLPRLTQVYFGMARDSLPWDHPDYPAFVVADHVLGGHFYSRLYVALRHEQGDTYGVGTVNHGDVEPGPYGVVTFTRVDNADVAERKLSATLETFRADGITEEERAAAIGFLRGRRAFARQSPDQVLARWMQERRLGLPAGFFDELVERAAQLKLAEINRFIAGYYDPAEFTLVRVAPGR